MKYLIVVFLTLLSLSSVAQQLNYEEWQKESKNEIRLIPEYGNAPKSKEQQQADQEFIATALKEDGSYRKASDHLVNLGFSYLYKGDIKTAMYRFNQAWLLDHKNENAFWGFASIYFTFNDYNEALKQEEKGLLINPNSSNILTDKATIYTGLYMTKHNIDYLNKAIEIFNKSYRIDQVNQNTLFKLSVAYFYKSDCSNAWKFYDECMKLGGKPIPQGYTEALKKQCSR